MKDLHAKQYVTQHGINEDRRRDDALTEALMHENKDRMKWQPQIWTFNTSSCERLPMEVYVSGVYVLMQGGFLQHVNPCEWVLVDPIGGRIAPLACDDLGSCMDAVESMVIREYADINSHA